MLNKGFNNPPTNQSRTVALEQEEARVEWETAVRNRIKTVAGIQRLMHESTPIDQYDRRWNYQCPHLPMLRIVQGKAGIWTTKQTGKDSRLLFSIPELGEGESLARSMVQYWNTKSASSFSLYDSLERTIRKLAELEISLKDVICETIISKDEHYRKAQVTWRGTFVWNAIDISAPKTHVNSVVVNIPGEEDRLLGDEDIPEITKAYAEWAAEYLDTKEENNEKDIIAGTLTIASRTTLDQQYRDDNGKLQTDGGDTIVTLLIDGNILQHVSLATWKHLQRHLQLRENDIVAFSTRQMNAVIAAYDDSIVRTSGMLGPYSTSLGPRGRRAMLAESSPKSVDAIQAIAAAKQSAEYTALAVKEHNSILASNAIILQRITENNAKNSAAYTGRNLEEFLQRVPTVEEIVEKWVAQETVAKNLAENNAAIQNAIEAEFPLETRQELRKKYQTLCAYFSICTTLPATSDERRKFIAETEKYPVSQLYADTIASFRGKKATEQSFVAALTTLKSLAQRQKINQDIPKLWEKISGRVEQWESITTLIDEEILKDGDITLLVNETLDGVCLTKSMLVTRVSRRFLSDPWRLTAADALTEEVKELFMLL